MSLSFHLIPIAFAATNSTGQPHQTGGELSFFIFILAFVVLFYFILWRPQAKRQKDMRNLLNSIAKGDEIVTSGGILGRIVKLTDDFVVIEIAKDVEIVVQKGAIGGQVPKGTMKNL